MSRPIALRGLAIVFLGLMLCALQAPYGHAATAGGRRDTPAATVSGTVDRYWTPKRLRAARPVESRRTTTRPATADDGVPPSHPFDGLPQVGTFFWTDGQNTGRFCGATVIRSPGRDLAVSAGHCLSHPDPKRYLSFVPQYHDGLKPHGIFPVGRVYIDQRYYALGPDPGARWDYSIVQLEPRADGLRAEDVVGGFGLGVLPGYDHSDVRLIGYPGSSDILHPKPLDCRSSTHRYTSTDPGAPGDFLEIACAGYIGGTSGGPFLVGGLLGYRVIGVIGGYHTGGDTPDISYSSYFTSDILALYLHAVLGDPPAGASDTWRQPTSG